MKTKFLFMMIAAATLTFVGCKEEDGETVPALNTDKTAIDAAYIAGTHTIAVTSNVAWTAAVNSEAAAWCTLAGASGNSNGTVTVNVTENPSIVTARAATVTVTSGTLSRMVAVAQAAATQALTVEPVAIDAAVSAASYSVAVTSNTTWTAAVNAGAAAWCTLVGASGNSNGTVTVNVTENPTAGVPRAATVTVTSGTLSRMVAVAQAAATQALTVEPVAIDAAVSAASYSVAVTSNTTWTAAVNGAATWCTASPATYTGSGSVTVNVALNAATVTRSATVTIAAGTLTRAVGVTQAAPMFYAASTQTWTFGTQTWSDAIHCTACDKESFTNSYTDPQCRNYTESGETWYYYNWAYVDANKASMCPDPWRVPAQSDFNTLASNTTASALTDAWRYGGYTQGSPVDLVSSRAYYWSSTVDSGNAQYAYYLAYYDGTLGVTALYKVYGFQVRCVK